MTCSTAVPVWPCKAPGGCALRTAAEGHVCLTPLQKSCPSPCLPCCRHPGGRLGRVWPAGEGDAHQAVQLPGQPALPFRRRHCEFTACSVLTAALSPAWQRSLVRPLFPEGVRLSEQLPAGGISLLPTNAGVGAGPQPSFAQQGPLQLPAGHGLSLASCAKSCKESVPTNCSCKMVQRSASD